MIDAAGHLGLGVELDAGRFRLMAEAGDYFSGFEQGTLQVSEPGSPSAPRQWQHDLAIKVGLGIGVR
jgi:hypothetical protein